MGKNRQRPGFTFLELIFVLTLMVAFTACFVIRPLRPKDNVAHATKAALSELVFLARLQSIDDTPVSLEVRGNKLEITKRKDHWAVGYYYNAAVGCWEKKYGKNLDSRVSDCKLINFPLFCKSSDFPQNPFKAGEIQQEKVVFEEKFFTPFQLKFLLDNKELYITVDTNAQMHTYEQEQ